MVIRINFSHFVSDMKKYALLLILLQLLFTSCLKDLYETVEDFENVERVKWDPDFAGPLVKTSMSLQDLALDSIAYVSTDQDGLLYLVYEGEAGSLTGSEIVSLDDQQFDVNVSLSPAQISDININDSVMAFYNVPITFNFTNDMDLDSFMLQEGELEIELTNQLPSDCRVVFNMPSVKQNNETLNNSVSVAAGGNATRSFPLSGARFNLASLSPAYNRLPVDVFLYVKKGSRLPSLTDQLNVKVRFKNLDYEHLFGLFSSEKIQSIHDTLDLNVVENAGIKGFTIEDPRLKFRFYNSFGVPVIAGIEPVEFISSGGSTTGIIGIPSPLPIPVPTYQQIGQLLVDSFELNKQTSNFASELSKKPSRFSYFAEGAIAPGSKRGFLSHNSIFKVEVAAEVPLWGSVQAFVLEQESDFVADLPEETDYIRSLNLKLFSVNRFPMSIELQAYFMDSNGQVLDSLLSDGSQLLPAASVDANGRVNEGSPHTLNIPFNQSRIGALKAANRIKIRAQLDTYNSGGNYPSVKFYEDYDLKIRLALQVGLTIEEEL